jgi:hypothetical protein
MGQNFHPMQEDKSCSWGCSSDYQDLGGSVFPMSLPKLLVAAYPWFSSLEIWKERNQRIFENKCISEESVWTTFKIHLQETLLLQPWSEQDLQANQTEAIILKNWSIWPHSYPFFPSIKRNSPSSPETWSHPPKGFYKLNFDGASKGNPGPAGFGGVFRNSSGTILRIFFGTLGLDSNNAT